MTSPSEKARNITENLCYCLTGDCSCPDNNIVIALALAQADKEAELRTVRKCSEIAQNYIGEYGDSFDSLRIGTAKAILTHFGVTQ